MSKAPRKMVVVALFCAVLFVAGLAKLFWLRFETGDVYPPYSSLRGDPLGTQVLYESLNRIQSDSAQRNYRPLNQMEPTADQTLLVIGLAGPGAFLKHDAWEKLLDRLALNGGRLVVAFRSSARQRASKRNEPCTGDDEEELQTPDDANCDEKGEKSSPAPPGEKDKGPTAEDGKNLDSHASWKGALATLGIAIKPSQADILDDFAEKNMAAPGSLPAAIPWRSPFYFILEDSAWQSLYQTAGDPVIAVRPWGKGDVVMASDSYLFSNEALRSDRFAGLLAWFIQPPHQVVIDEFHNGLVRKPGIADLMRKYRLHGLLASLALLLVLLMWRQTAVFVTKPAESIETAHDIEAGSDTAEGLAGLMQQHVRADELLRVCYEAWHTSGAAGSVTEERMTRIKSIIADSRTNPRRKDIVTAYQQICELLKQGKFS